MDDLAINAMKARKNYQYGNYIGTLMLAGAVILLHIGGRTTTNIWLASKVY
jgi:hypothetical protein